jgi:hypothetical protein
MFHITVHNPHGAGKGVAEMHVDGKLISGNVIPLDLPGAEHQVEVWLGG